MQSANEVVAERALAMVKHVVKSLEVVLRLNQIVQFERLLAGGSDGTGVVKLLSLYGRKR